ncbi:GTP-binding protein Rit1 isoform X3 [Megalobrama amblycephala]|uniref:GTP-binding protein Rit1 isoform X3 n=1 Tax=Megalobrama amblycephala TaxID=75352 RepID=UPI002013E3D9|nr:GTP-binding protein Rit1 isoform X3 [Megalobrama amblycephala]
MRGGHLVRMHELCSHCLRVHCRRFFRVTDILSLYRCLHGNRAEIAYRANTCRQQAIIMQFISHRFPEDHDPTIEDAYKTQIRIDDEPANLDILDTAGQAEFTAMRDQYMRAGEGFIISYSITDRRSFQEARHFKQLIYRVRRTVDTPVVLVGNKSDLVHLRQLHPCSFCLYDVSIPCQREESLMHSAATSMLHCRDDVSLWCALFDMRQT